VQAAIAGLTIQFSIMFCAQGAVQPLVTAFVAALKAGLVPAEASGYFLLCSIDGPSK